MRKARIPASGIDDARAAGTVRAFFRRVDVRLTLWFSILFLITALLLFGFTFGNLYQTMRDENRAELQSRAFGYYLQFSTAINERTGITELVNELRNEMLTPTGQPLLVRIVTSNNDPVFVGIPVREWQEFDLSPLAAGATPQDRGFATISGPRHDYELEVLCWRLSSNYVLQIGNDTSTRVQVLRAFQTSFLFTFVVMFGVSLAAGLFFVSRSLRPIGSLNATVRSIIQTGELDRRIPSRQSNDDLDDMISSVNDMLDRIHALVAGLRDALDSVAHDLRTPLTRLRSTAERALSGESDPDAYREALSDAMEESERILGMLNSMMDISEAESGAMNLHRQDVDLTELAREVAEVYGLLAEESGMKIDVTIEAKAIVHVDPSRMRQVIGNLYDNAVKYGERGSSIIVEAHVTHDHHTVFSVTNRGTPIAQQDMDRIWNRLYRGSGVGAHRDGLGLGLALVKAIVEAHGGTVGVECDERFGTRFSISLPPSSASITNL